MKTFKDSKGRLWQIAVNVFTVKQVKSQLDVDLTQAVVMSSTPQTQPDVSLIDRLNNDPVLLADVLYVICRQEAEEKGVSDEEFGRSLAGRPIADATMALLEEIVDFFPDPARRSIGHLVLNGMNQLAEKTEKLVADTLQNPEFTTEFNTRMEQLLDNATSSPASAE